MIDEFEETIKGFGGEYVIFKTPRGFVITPPVFTTFPVIEHAVNALNAFPSIEEAKAELVKNVKEAKEGTCPCVNCRAEREKEKSNVRNLFD